VHPITVLFIVVLSAGLALRLYLAARQMRAAREHRERVPAPFAGAIDLAAQRKAADYTLARTRSGSLETLVDTLLVLSLTLGGVIAAIESGWRHAGWPELWYGAAVVASVLLLSALVSLPFSIWSIFRVEARFGFNRTTPLLFLMDRLKGLLLAIVLGLPLLLAVLWLMQRAGRAWWLFAWLAWLAFSAFLAWAWPAFIAPLFNRFTPLNDAVLRGRIEALLVRCRFASKGVFVVDGSRRSAHGNAYFTGLGRNKRIVFFDTLLERLDAAEVEAVLAHELGHFRLRHTVQRLLVSAVIALATLALLAWLARQPWFYSGLGVPRPSPHAALLLFLLVTPAFTYFATPLGAWWSRLHEFAADRFAAQHADAGALAAALVKLYRDNAALLTPDRLHSAFYDSHPPALVRIATLRALEQS
jgi:STE24 endopeptidase